MRAVAGLAVAAALLATLAPAQAAGRRRVALVFPLADTSPPWAQGAVAAYLQRRGLVIGERGGALRLTVTVALGTTPFGATHVSSAHVSVSVDGSHLAGQGKASHVDVLTGQQSALDNALDRLWPSLDAALTAPPALTVSSAAPAAESITVEVRIHGEGCADQGARLAAALRIAAKADAVDVVTAVPGLCGFRTRTSLAAPQLATRLQAALSAEAVEVTPRALRLRFRSRAERYLAQRKPIVSPE